MLYGDINQDGQSDLTVYYSIEGVDGGNNHFEYIAVFLTNNGVLKPATFIEVGEDLQRFVRLVAVKNNVIELKTLEYGPNDGRFSPSIEGKTFYIFEKGDLKELKDESKLINYSQDKVKKIKIENAAWKKIPESGADIYFNSKSFREIDGYITFDIIDEEASFQTLQADCKKNAVRLIGEGVFKSETEVEFKPFVDAWSNITDDGTNSNFLYKLACDNKNNKTKN